MINSGALPATSEYWVFVCNPKKWAIDQFLERRIENDSWGVRPSDRERFAPGQLGILRVGVDQRTKEERKGRPALESGIYALCEVESEVFEGTGATSEFWTPGQERAPGWPTVRIRYVRTYPRNPVTIATLRAKRPDISKLLLNGFQASSFPISSNDFRAIAELLGEDIEELPLPIEKLGITPEEVITIEERFLHASPERKEKISKTIERGNIGNFLKRKTGFKCQLCEALGREPLGFLKRDGERYVEAHHAMPVSKGMVGSLAASNIMILCANHHRQMHYGGIDLTIDAKVFAFVLDGSSIKIPRLGLL